MRYTSMLLGHSASNQQTKQTVPAGTKIKGTLQKSFPPGHTELWTHLTDNFVLVDERLVGLVVKVSAPGVEDPGFESCSRWDFSRSSHTSDFKIGTPVATLSGAWRYRVSAETGQPGVSILWLGEIESLICSFYFSVAACKIVCADPSLRYTSRLQGREATNQPTNLADGVCESLHDAMYWFCHNAYAFF